MSNALTGATNECVRNATRQASRSAVGKADNNDMSDAIGEDNIRTIINAIGNAISYGDDDTGACAGNKNMQCGFETATHGCSSRGVTL